MKIIRADQLLPGKKKLALVLDLDHTLIHSKYDGILSPEEKYLLDEPNPSVFRWEKTLIKLRPFAKPFIKQASTFFDLYIYTMAKLPYALTVAKLLDPDGSYINPSHVIGKETIGTKRNKKTLDLVPYDNKHVLIVDDTKEVWLDHIDNLVHIKKYHYFASPSTKREVCLSLSESRTDEDVASGALSSVLDVVKSAHRMFYNEIDVESRDVRIVVTDMRMRILEGCKIAISENTEKGKSVWKMVEEMGAICCKISDPSASHVVLSDGEGKMVVEKKGKFLVRVQWVEAAYYSWCRHDEEKFQFDV